MQTAASKNIPSSSGCDATQPHCDILRGSGSLSSKHHRDRGYRSSSSVIGCEASYRSHRSDIEDIQEDLDEDNANAGDHAHQKQPQVSSSGGQSGGQSGVGGRLETHSCPSSPTETECSSGFSTLRRRSVTLTEKVSLSSSTLTRDSTSFLDTVLRRFSTVTEFSKKGCI